MWCSAHIRRFIYQVPQGELFTTRDCLSFGSRAAVDKALSRLVKSDFIVRVARGVFVRHNWKNVTITAFDVAKKKAESFGRTIARHGADIAHQFGLTSHCKKWPIYQVTGGSSSFVFGDTVIWMKGTCPRKMRLGDSYAGQVIRALWHLGRLACTPGAVQKAAAQSWKRTDRQELRQSVAWMPAWMSSYFIRC